MSNLQEKIKDLPKSPGVYLMKSDKGKIIYIGKATSLQDRVSSYWTRPHDSRIEQLVAEIKDIDYRVTPTVIEALVLEANMIKKYQPKYNVKLRDDKSFLYLGITKEDFPRLVLLRGVELLCHPDPAAAVEGSPGSSRISHAREILRPDKSGLRMTALFGPYTNASSLRAALDILRKIFPYRSCEIMPKRPCLFYQIKRCPAPCVDKISRKDYNYIIRQIILFFQGKKFKIIKNLDLKMKKLAEEEKFEQAGEVKNKIFALEHIRDVAVISRDDIETEKFLQRKIGDDFINVFGRIEGYDISNIDGREAVGSMVVFQNGRAKKSDYRKFKIKTVEGSNDVGMLKEVLERRFRRTARKSPQPPLTKVDYWPRPDLILIDGGRGQVNAALGVLQKYKLSIPVIGIAKGITRKKDEFIFDKFSGWALELERIASNYTNLLKQVRNEAHRFAISYHRLRRKKKLFGK
jgi:excinuclease ABC subunit C